MSSLSMEHTDLLPDKLLSLRCWSTEVHYSAYVTANKQCFSRPLDGRSASKYRGFAVKLIGYESKKRKCYQRILVKVNGEFYRCSWTEIQWPEIASVKKEQNWVSPFCICICGRGMGSCFKDLLLIWQYLNLLAGLWFLGLSSRNFISFCNIALATGPWMPLSEQYVSIYLPEHVVNKTSTLFLLLSSSLLVFKSLFSFFHKAVK